MTFYAIYQDILQELNISADTYERISEQEIVDAINEAQKEVARLGLRGIHKDLILAYLSKESKILDISNPNEDTVTLPSDFLEYLGAWRDYTVTADTQARSNQVSFSLITEPEARTLYSNPYHRPTVYNPYIVLFRSDDNPSCKIYPPIQSTLTKDDVYLYYLKKPAEWSGTSDTTSTPELPELLLEALKYYACYLIVKRAESGFEEKAQEYYNLALEKAGIPVNEVKRA